MVFRKNGYDDAPVPPNIEPKTNTLAPTFPAFSTSSKIVRSFLFATYVMFEAAHENAQRQLTTFLSRYGVRLKHPKFN
jgi:hypothetical protein